jgi:hypothetical protein
VRLFLAARPTIATVVLLAGIGAVTTAARSVPLPAFQPGLGEPYVPVLLAYLAPVIASVVIGLAAESPMPSWERLAARNLRAVRAAHAAALVVLAGLTLLPAVLLLDYPGATRTLPANLFASAGLSLLAGVALDPRSGWLLVVPYSVLGLMAGQTTPTPWRSLLLIDAAPSASRLAAAAVVLAAGLTAHALQRPPRPAHGDTG